MEPPNIDKFFEDEVTPLKTDANTEPITSARWFRVGKNNTVTPTSLRRIRSEQAMIHYIMGYKCIKWLEQFYRIYSWIVNIFLVFWVSILKEWREHVCSVSLLSVFFIFLFKLDILDYSWKFLVLYVFFTQLSSLSPL